MQFWDWHIAQVKGTENTTLPTAIRHRFSFHKKPDYVKFITEALLPVYYVHPFNYRSRLFFSSSLVHLDNIVLCYSVLISSHVQSLRWFNSEISHTWYSAISILIRISFTRSQSTLSIETYMPSTNRIDSESSSKDNNHFVCKPSSNSP